MVYRPNVIYKIKLAWFTQRFLHAYCILHTYTKKESLVVRAKGRFCFQNKMEKSNVASAFSYSSLSRSHHALSICTKLNQESRAKNKHARSTVHTTFYTATPLKTSPNKVLRSFSTLQTITLFHSPECPKGSIPMSWKIKDRKHLQQWCFHICLTYNRRTVS